MFSIILMSLISLVIVIFAMLNSQTVSLNFVFTEVQGSLAFVAVITFCCGLLVMGIYSIMQQTKNYLKMKELEEIITKLQEDKAELEKLNAYLKKNAGRMPPQTKPKPVENPYLKKWME